MDQNKLLFYLETLHTSFGIPLVYSSADGQAHHFQPFSVATGENELDFIIRRLQGVHRQLPDRHVMFLQHPSLVMLGLVTSANSKEFIFLGPVAAADAREEGIADYLFSAGLSAEATRQLSAYLTSSKLWTSDMVRQTLRNINLILNDEILPDEQIGLIEDRETELKLHFYREHYRQESEVQERNEPVAIQDYTNRLNYCLMHGDTSALLQMLSQLSSVPFSQDFAVTPARLRQTAYGSVFASETVALKSGIPAANLKITKQYYLDRIDRAASPDECRRLAISAMLDFTKRVKEYLSEKTENPTVRRAVEYIKENLNTKLVAADIAAAVHVSPHYLFTKFKQETGKTLTEYINEEKIKKACYYIVYTGNSFSEIANFLSFSSQSYFQSVFKKVMGQTPNKWKQANRN